MHAGNQRHAPRPLRARDAVLLGLLALGQLGCASSVRSVQERAVREELELVEWTPASAADVVGHWRVRSLQGPAAGVVMDLGYWIGAGGGFSGAALFAGEPPAYQVLSGAWSLSTEGELQLGAESEPARAEVARVAPGKTWLRLSGAEGSLVFERADIR